MHEIYMPVTDAHDAMVHSEASFEESIIAIENALDEVKAIADALGAI